MAERVSTNEILRCLSELHIQPWAGVFAADITLSVVTGGLTNTLYCAKLNNVSTYECFLNVIFRVVIFPMPEF